ncbi:MAG: hypothetical protein E7607_08765 [Ruminococcaceae bacterium]|nr:hypothetical protein [Oscillospiraceae bacterium]
MENKNIKIPRKGKNLKIITAVAVAVCIVINVIVCLLPISAMRLEVSKDGNYSISEDTRSFLNSLKNETVAYVVDSDGSDRRFEYFMQEIDACSDKLKVKFIKSDSEEMQQVIKENGITTVEILPYSIIVAGKNGATFISYENTMYYLVDSALYSFIGSDRLDVNGYRECLQYVESGIAQDVENAATWQNIKDLLLNNSVRVFYGEEIICRMVEYVNVETFPARYYVMGHGETELNKTELGYNLAGLCQAYSISYYKPLDTTKLTAIPDDASALVILDPKSDFSAEEAQMLIDFVKRGGDITLVTSNGCLSMPNLMSVANAYGLYGEKGLITEEIEIEAPESEGSEPAEKEEQESDNGESGEPNTDGNPNGNDENKVPQTQISNEVLVSPNTNHEAMALLVQNNTVGIPSIKNANAITYKNVDPNVELTPLLTTSDKVMLDGVKVEKSLAVAVIAEYVTSGGMLAWYTGAESYTYDILERTSKGEFDIEGMDETQLTELATKLYNVSAVLGTAVLSPFSYETEIPTVAPKPFANDLLNVTDRNFIVYTIVALFLVIGVGAIGGAICYKRKKK